MSDGPILRFASRGWRDLPTPVTRIRGSGELPYNPERPLTLPGDRRRKRPPQFRTDSLLRLLIPLVLLAGLGLGVFFGVDALLDKGSGDPTVDQAELTVATVRDAANGQTGMVL